MRDAIEVRWVPAAHALNGVGLAGTFAAALANHGPRPGLVPVHFDLAGNPDRWGQNTWATALALPAAALAGTALVYAAAALVAWARRHPASLNLPQKAAFLALPPARQEPVWRHLRAMAYWLAVPQTLVFLTLAALRPGADGRLRIWPVFLPCALLLALVPVLAVRLSRQVRRAVAEPGAERSPAA